MFKFSLSTGHYEQGELLLEPLPTAYRARWNGVRPASYSFDPLTMKKKPASVCTIGYEQSTPAEFAARLAEARINMVIDVRAVPLSRKPGFSKNQLAAALTAMDVEYKHFVRLGAPRAVRDALRDGGTWAGYEHGYNAHLARQREEVQALLDLAAERSICLLCFERDPEVCHRSLIARQMAAEQPDLVIHHIRY